MIYYKVKTGSRYWHIDTPTSDFDDYYIGDTAIKNFDIKQFPPQHTIVSNIYDGIPKLCVTGLKVPHEICVLFPDEGEGIFYDWVITHNEQIITASKLKYFYIVYSLKGAYENLSKINLKKIAYKFLILDLCYIYAQLGDGHFKDAINKVRENNLFYRDIRLGKYSTQELKEMNKQKVKNFLSVKDFYIKGNFDVEYLKKCEQELHQLTKKR